MGASITIDYAEFAAILKARDEAKTKVAELEHQIVETRLGDPNGPIRNAVEVARNAIDIVRYAMGNLSPEFAKKWPFENLEKLATAIETMPDFSIDDGVLAMEMRSFARDCRRWEETRSLKTIKDEASRVEKETLKRLVDLAADVEPSSNGVEKHEEGSAGV